MIPLITTKFDRWVNDLLIWSLVSHLIIDHYSTKCPFMCLSSRSFVCLIIFVTVGTLTEPFYPSILSVTYPIVICLTWLPHLSSMLTNCILSPSRSQLPSAISTTPRLAMDDWLAMEVSKVLDLYHSIDSCTIRTMVVLFECSSAQLVVLLLFFYNYLIIYYTLCYFVKWWSNMLCLWVLSIIFIYVTYI